MCYVPLQVSYQGSYGETEAAAQSRLAQLPKRLRETGDGRDRHNDTQENYQGMEWIESY